MSDLREEISECLDQLKDALDVITERDKRIAELEAQLPESMQDCTIVFKECHFGHGRLTAKNWIDHGCSTCKINKLKVKLLESDKRIAELGAEKQNLNNCLDEEKDVSQGRQKRIEELEAENERLMDAAPARAEGT